jgi:hypothetical protein
MTTVPANSGSIMQHAHQKGQPSGAPAAHDATKVRSAIEYAPAPESVKVDIKPAYGHYINGAWTKAGGDASFASVNPATEAPLSLISQGSEKDVEQRSEASCCSALQGAFKNARESSLCWRP